MATPADARAIKSLSTGEGSKKFVYKSIVQQIAKIDINVYRSLNPVKAEPSEGSTFTLHSTRQSRKNVDPSEGSALTGFKFRYTLSIKVSLVI
ncbi:unnamed protein product [Coffea canephora]|uniref:DH200=94 genomic scaffold, scaffold_478 n=1 Tax=Coffea canephora TaxID=49390 RepID=A0A068VF13_COFCA|nr:unnamed protein product [Coffea canephora]